MPGQNLLSSITVICCVAWYRHCPSLVFKFSTCEYILGFGMELMTVSGVFPSDALSVISWPESRPSPSIPIFYITGFPHYTEVAVTLDLQN